MSRNLRLIAIAVIIGALLLITVPTGISLSNEEIDLRSAIAAQQDVCTLRYDTMWKVIRQGAQIPIQYKEAFKEIFPTIMEGRYGNARGGALMSWITEANPDFKVSLFEDLARKIEEQREAYFQEQKKLRSLAQQHYNVLHKFPGSYYPIKFFLLGRKDVKITLVTSAKTKDVYKTGEDNDVDLFPTTAPQPTAPQITPAPQTTVKPQTTFKPQGTPAPATPVKPQTIIKPQPVPVPAPKK